MGIVDLWNLRLDIDVIRNNFSVSDHRDDRRYLNGRTWG
jgi:steroid 5-alpha reductase family enzyme